MLKCSIPKVTNFGGILLNGTWKMPKVKLGSIKYSLLKCFELPICRQLPHAPSTVYINYPECILVL